MIEKFLYKTSKKSNSKLVAWMGFPGPYSFSMSSLGFLWMFKELDEAEDIYAERVCADTENTIHKIPDIFGFSFSFDMDFLTILSMLDKYKIPFKSKDRGEFPLIFAGGPVVTANPEPYKDIFDFFVIGDGENVNLTAANICKNNKDKSKQDILKLLSEQDGIYVPNISKRVQKQTTKLQNCVYTPILSDEAYFKNTFIVEISRGCTNRCGFCLASYLNFPLRSVQYNELINSIELGLKNTNKIALLGAEVSAHPRFKDVLNLINSKIHNGQNIEINLSSLRVDAVSDEVIKTLVLAGQNTVTLAIEAGSERLRKFINKNLTEEQILNAINIARNNGLKGVKLYGMIGIPTETEDDINSLILLAKKIKKEYKGFDISFGFSSFVPKPHTPFQWFGREDSKTLEKKCMYLQKELHKIGIQANMPSIKWDYWQAVLSRGDSSFTDFIIDVYKQGGKLGAFKSAAKKYAINSDIYAYKNYSFDDNLPWDFIDMSPGKEFLISENKRLININ